MPFSKFIVLENSSPIFTWNVLSEIKSFIKENMFPFIPSFLILHSNPAFHIRSYAFSKSRNTPIVWPLLCHKLVDLVMNFNNLIHGAMLSFSKNCFCDFDNKPFCSKNYKPNLLEESFFPLFFAESRRKLEMGLYESGECGLLLGLTIGRITPYFHTFGSFHVFQIWLYNVRITFKVTSGSSFIKLYGIESPQGDDFFSLLLSLFLVHSLKGSIYILISFFTSRIIR